MPEAVISNTSPLQYLYLLGHLQLLPHFYQQVRIPPAVVQELAAGRALGVSLPDPGAIAWLHEHIPLHATTMRLASTLGAGEREAFALALATPGALVLMDDGRARRIGHKLRLNMTGTIGILVRATREGVISQLAPMLDRLAELGFRLSTEARTAALAHVGEH